MTEKKTATDKKVLATFKIDESAWIAFKDKCDKAGNSASYELQQFIFSAIGKLPPSSPTTAIDIESSIENYLESNIERLIGGLIESNIEKILEDRIKAHTQPLEQRIDDVVAVGK